MHSPHLLCDPVSYIDMHSPHLTALLPYLCLLQVVMQHQDLRSHCNSSNQMICPGTNNDQKPTTKGNWKLVRIPAMRHKLHLHKLHLHLNRHQALARATGSGKAVARAEARPGQGAGHGGKGLGGRTTCLGGGGARLAVEAKEADELRVRHMNG